MELQSADFKDGGNIPLAFVMTAIGGKNISPGFSWKNSPPGTKSFAFSMVDPHPVAHNWVHWLVVNIPPEVPSLPRGASGKAVPSPGKELENSFGFAGYGGPQPPAGSGDHPYVCIVYALSVDKLTLPAKTSLGAFNHALEGVVLAKAQTTGHYTR
ncbi:MAG: YbhB/YbcL family Raf kinase inhibitor-like protein [Deltaproteobacteria bacterium]|nr:YbhB/YbcL family Raf kinase inhibitor-like protein [Deltaproteobacteria bacterium]